MKTARKASYRWHLRRLMAENDMYATTELGQVYRLVTGTPERLSLATLAALCDILGCGPGIWSSRSPVPPAPASRPRRRSPLRARSAPGPGPGHGPGIAWPAARPDTRPPPRGDARPAAAIRSWR